jgi:hypothetical protein
VPLAGEQERPRERRDAEDRHDQDVSPTRERLQRAAELLPRLDR